MMGSLMLALIVLQAPQVPVQTREVVAEIRVHGNQIVPDAEVLKIAGVAIGEPFTDAVLKDAAKRLKDSGHFESIDVLKRFASIEDATRIVVVIIVNEGPVRIVMPEDPNGALQVKKRTFFNNLMFVPVLEGSDGYGLTYGARVAYPKVLGPNSRVSFPMTLGGTKRIGVELEKTFASGPISRIEFGSGVQRKMNPAYDEEDDRTRVWARAQRMMGIVRAGATASWQQVSFGLTDDTYRSVGADIVLDTRENPALPRNAVLATASVDQLVFASGQSLTRTRLEANGYIGLYGQQVLVLRAQRESVSDAEPLYLRSILGGWNTLRGFETGFLTGDTLVAGSIEWRIPVTTPLKFGKMGVSAFTDWGTAYNHGQSFNLQPIYRGAGGTVWFSVASFRMSMAVAYGFGGSGTHVHFSGALGF